MSDVGEGSAVDEGRITLQGLNEVGKEGFSQEQRHRSCGFEILRLDGVALDGGADDDLTETVT